MIYKKIERHFEFLAYDADSLRNVDDYVYGENGLNSKEIFAQRKKYQLVHPDSTAQQLSAKKLDEFFSYLNSETAANRAVPINFWMLEQSGYGKRDVSKNFIYPKEFYYKQISNPSGTGESIFVLNFVADAFEDLMKYLKIEKRKFLAEDNFLTKNLKPVRGVQQLSPLHERVLVAHYNSFITMITMNRKINSNIVDFESFLDNFLNVYGSLAVKEYPISKTGLLQSNKIGPNVSGLCVELSKEPHDKDKQKKEKYLDSPNYHFYAAAAAQFGFMVDKNAPWRLVANIYSPKMRPYIQKYFQNYSNEGWTTPNLDHSHYYMGYTNSLIEGAENPQRSIKTTDIKTYSDGPPVTQHTHVITRDGEISIEVAQPSGVGNDGISVGKGLVDHTHGIEGVPILDWTTSDFYKKFYTKTNTTDVEGVKNTILGIYQRFINEYPKVNVPQVCYKKIENHTGYFIDGSKIETKFKEVRRQPYVSENYGDLFWIKTYMIVRMTEMGKEDLINRDMLNKVMSDVNQLYYYVDKSAAMVYADNYLKQYH